MNSNPNLYTSDDDADIRLALESFAAPAELSEDLRRRLQVSAHEAYSRRPAVLKLWRPLAAVAGTCAAVTVAVVLTMTPTKAMAKSFDLVQSAVSHAKTFQFSIRSEDDGKPQSFSIVAANGRFTMKTSDGPLMKLDGKEMEIYNRDENTVMEMDFGGIPGASNLMDQVQNGMKGMKDMDLKQMLSDYRAKYGDQNIRVSPVRAEDGQSVYDVDIAAPDQPERVHLTVDAATDLPHRIVVDKENDGNWATEMTMDIKFDQAVDPRLLELDFPKDAKHQKIDLGAMMKGMGGPQAFEGLKGLGGFGGFGEDKPQSR